MPEERINSLREFVETKPELYAGIWTWSRGGGWEGPYIKDELWCDLNAWVMAQWGQNTDKSEAFIFNRYATERLHLKGKDVAKFRKLCLLSAEAVVRGRNSTYGDMNPWWTRDQGISWPMVAKGTLEQERNLAQKDESVKKWKEIVKLAKTIHWKDKETKSHAIGSAEYGLELYKIYRALIYMQYADANGNTKEVQKWIKVYDKAWKSYNKLAEKYSLLATLYTQEYTRHIKNNAHHKVNGLRE
jgi:hypothetical protein